MIWQPEFTDKTLSRKPGAVQFDDGGHLFLLFNLDREAIKPAQSKFPLKQILCDALERNQTLGEFTVKKALVIEIKRLL
ncbi:hypothetical protein EVX98_16510 [Escherichia coli]|nr:hypothetical protein EVX98_16510 [Escherichia coli]